MAKSSEKRKASEMWRKWRSGVANNQRNISVAASPGGNGVAKSTAAAKQASAGNENSKRKWKAKMMAWRRNSLAKWRHLAAK